MSSWSPRSGGGGGGGSGTVTSVAAADTSIVISGTPTVAPKVATGTLDVIAADHPTVADISMSGHALTAAADLAVSGITGAVTASRYVGGTASGAPTTGTFALGDFVIDAGGRVWVCVIAGTPGSWRSVGGGGTGLGYLAPANSLGETFPRMFGASNQVTLVSQTLRLMAIGLHAGKTITTINFWSGTTPLTVGVNQLAGLYDDSLGTTSGTPYALLRGSTDRTNTAWAANAKKSFTLTATYRTLRDGFFYIGILINATTPPTLAGSTGGSSNLAGEPPVISGNSSATVTALPNPAAAPTANGAEMYAWLT